jgi:vacuolar-type H+-ATPase subunit I/STV1
MYSNSGQTPSRKTLTDEELKRLESQRNDVRQVITRKLEERSKIENMNFAYKRYKDLGVEIEKELFQRHGDMDTKYRKWLKLFISAVLENKNNVFSIYNVYLFYTILSCSN